MYKLFLISLSGHKDTRSLESYDPALDSLHKMDMMAAIAQGGAGQRGIYLKIEFMGTFVFAQFLKNTTATAQVAAGTLTKVD